MKYNKEFINIEDGLKKEWILTNGIGGYSSSTILGANTRRYHGLLVAPLTPPARRFVILSKLDESIEINEKEYNLYTNIGKNFLTEGFKNQESFEKSEQVIFKYNVGNVVLEKSICMEYGRNTVIVYYKIENKNDNDVKLKLAPVLNFRDFHCINQDHNFDVKQEINNTKIKVIIDANNEYPIYMKLSEGNYIKHEDDIFKNMFYIEEEKRGFEAEENHVIPGIYEIEIKKGEEKNITFVCSLEENIDEIEAKQIIGNEKRRITSLVKKSNLTNDFDSEFVRNYIIASDNFIVNRPSFGLHTIIAGYPWFLDWGRDTLISFEGLLLIPKRYKEAKEVLLTITRDIKYGLVPNGYSGFDNRPLYNSVDSSLLLFEQVKKYLKYTNDEKFVKEKLYDKLVKIIYSYMSGIDVDNNNIYLDADYLIVSGTKETQNTWMDAKIGNFAVTPRNGKAVEINSMWYNALKIMEEITTKFFGEKFAKPYSELAKKCKISFEEKFYQKRRKSLYDVLGDKKIRPNQLFAIGLSYPVLDCNKEEAKEVFQTVTKKLLTPYGLKTLAKGEDGYVEVYEGDSYKRDSSYHQGITWPWLLGIYNDAFKNIINAEKNKSKKKELEKEYSNFVQNVKETFLNEIENGKTVGSISELYDSVKPYESKGAFAQGWSVAEIFRIIINN